MQDFRKGGSRKEVRAEILATPPQQQPQSMRILMLLQQYLTSFHMLLSKQISYLPTSLQFSATQLA